MTTKQPAPKNLAAQLDQIEVRLAETRPLPAGSHVQRDPWHMASAIEEILDVHVPALIAEVRALRERIAAADRIHHRHAHNDICDSRPWAPCDAEDACEHDGEQWPCPTHTALHPEDHHA